MEKYCRICLCEDSRNNFQRFTHKFENSFTVYYYYNLLSNITLTQIECKKSKICLDCLSKLNLFYTDRCKAITNNDIMNKWCNEGEWKYLI